MAAKQRNFKESTRRLFLMYTFVPLIVLFILFLVFTVLNTKAVLVNKTKEASKTISRSIADVYLSYYNEINRMAESPLIVDYARTKLNGQEVYEQFYDFNNKQKVKSVFHIIDVHGVFIASSAQSEMTVQDMIFKEIIPRISESPSSTLVETNYVHYSHDRNTVYTFGKAIVDHGTIVGYIMYQLFEEDVQKLIFVRNNEISLITDQYKNIIATSNNITRGLMNKFYPTYDSQGYVQLNDGKYYMSQTSVPIGQMNVYTLNSMQIQKYTYLSLTVFFVAASLLLGLLLHFLANKMSSHNTQSIDKLIYAVKELEQGHLQSYVEIKTGDEFETLADQYNRMLDRLTDLKIKNEELSTIRRVIEVKHLQAQFHPHFIFNVLEILRYAIVVDSKQAQEIVLILSRLLRYSISNDGQTVLLKDDLNHVADYLMLQEFRFNQRLSYTMDVSDEGRNALVPKLLLQAIIENSVKYGYKHRESLHLSIRGYVRNQDLVLEVNDNGYGMSEERLLEIRAILNNPDNQTKHIGLNNIHRRLVLLYGESYGIQIQSEWGSGTGVTVVIPYEKGDDGV